MQSLNSPLNSGCLEFKRVKVAEKNIFELSSFINDKTRVIEPSYKYRFKERLFISIQYIY